MKVESGNINAIIARNIKLARHMRELTLKDIGDILGVTGQQAQKYEACQNPISIDKLMLLSKALGFPITFFFEEFKWK